MNQGQKYNVFVSEKFTHMHVSTQSYITISLG